MSAENPKAILHTAYTNTHNMISQIKTAAIIYIPLEKAAFLDFLQFNSDCECKVFSLIYHVSGIIDGHLNLTVW